MTATAAVALGSPCLRTSRPQGLWCHAGTRTFEPADFAAPQAPSTCYSVPGVHCHMCKWTPGSTLWYFGGDRRLPSPQRMEAQCSLPTLHTGVLLLLHQRAGTLLLQWVAIRYSEAARRPASQGAKRPSTLHCAWQQENTLPHTTLTKEKSCNQAPPLSGNLLLCRS
jgi:hypothetical protein